MKNGDVFKVYAYPFGTSFMHFTDEFSSIKIFIDIGLITII